MNKVITQFQQILGVVPTGKYGAQTYMDFNYSGIARSVDTISLTIDGLIAYLYYNAYGVGIPDIFSSPPASTTDIEKQQIYSVYDAINVPRPSL